MLKELRKQRKLTQRDLAGILKVSLDTVKSWECGRRNPSKKAMKKLTDMNGAQQ